MKKSHSAPKGKASHQAKRHGISLNAEAFALLRAERSKASPSTYSGAVQALAATKQTIAAPTATLIDLHSPDMQEPRTQFTTEQAAIKGCESLRDTPISTAALIEQAASYSGMSISDFIKASVTEASRKRIIDHKRAQAGATNAKGSADAKILAAIEDLKQRGEPVTVARIRAMTGCNRLAVERHVQPVPRTSNANSSTSSEPAAD